MAAYQSQTRPEPTTVAGEILVSHNHIALLHGLYDRPGGTVPSHAEWVRASLPHVARFRRYPSKACLSLATRTVHPRWVTRVRRGRRIEVALTQRGRAIIERRLPARIRGWGTYEGMKTISWRDHFRASVDAAVRPLSPDSIREAVAYANAYGIPLIEQLRADNEKDLTVFAVTTGLGRSFTLKSREELELRGPRRWHAVWTRAQVDLQRLPDGYRAAFSEYDQEDVLCYLRELKGADRDKEVYCRTYAGRDFLSETKLHEWLSEEIDFLQTDIGPSDLILLIRALSDTHCKLAAAVAGSGALSWRHPDTGKVVGRVFSQDIDGHGNHQMVASSCAALTCLQSHFDSLGLGIRIETRYLSACV